jgi:LAGLIDADG endonuclease
LHCSILKTGAGSTGLTVKLEFKITQKSHSEGILHEVRNYYGCGSVVIDNRSTDTKKYHVTSISDILLKIIPHFNVYPCLTSKYLNFNDWKKIAIIMSNKEHLTNKGIEKIIDISSRMNTKRSFEDKFNYCKSSLGFINKNFIKFDLPAYWVQTYLTGESMFYSYIATKISRGKSYQGCDSSLEIAQNSHDVHILLAIMKFFNGGYIKPKYNFNDILECKNSRSVNRYILRDTETIIKFVVQYPMLTRKYLDYIDWKKIVELKNSGAHKTEEGLNLMKEILSKMNSKRDLE